MDDVWNVDYLRGRADAWESAVDILRVHVGEGHDLESLPDVFELIARDNRERHAQALRLSHGESA